MIRNDPSFTCKTSQNSATVSKTQQQRTAPKQKLSVKKSIVSSVENKPHCVCPIHPTDHKLNECRLFRAKPMSVRRKFLNDNPRGDAGGLSREYVIRVPSVS